MRLVGIILVGLVATATPQEYVCDHPSDVRIHLKLEEAQALSCTIYARQESGDWHPIFFNADDSNDCRERLDRVLNQGQRNGWTCRGYVYRPSKTFPSYPTWIHALSSTRIRELT